MSTNDKVDSKLNGLLQQKAEFVNALLAQLMDKLQNVEPRLLKAMRYTLEAGGKRIRAAIVLWSCETVIGHINPAAEAACVAVEMVHTYSLVHDDLPAMDNDQLRRGRATCHIAFDEATAILTGDALLTLAFELLAKKVESPALATKLIGQLTEAAGPGGMIAGQMADLIAENTESDKKILEYIHINKTAKMFRAAAQMGAVAADADAKQLRALSEYGLKIGLGFQIADDILDVSGTSKQLGKTAGKDAKAGKITYPALIGIAKSREMEKQLANKAVSALQVFDNKADPLRQLAGSLLHRTR